MKKYNLIPLVLLIYLGVMIYLGYPSYKAGLTSPLLYFGGSVFTVLVIILLRFTMIRRERYRRERQDDMNRNKK